jgi:phosphoglycerate dehydrogenase-like enzyme
MTAESSAPSVSAGTPTAERNRSTATIVLVGPRSEEERTRVQEVAPTADIVFADALADVPNDVLARAAVIAGSVPESRFSDAGALEWVHTWAAGPNADLHPAMLASDVILTSSVGNGAIPLAEHAMMLALILNRDYPRWARAQAAHRWDRFTHAELAGSTMGILGVGHSGADLAQKAHAFHMRVLGLRRNPDRSVDAVDEMLGLDGLDRLLTESDVLVVTAPYTDATRGLLGERELRLMKPTATLIVFSRGGIVDDDALLRALSEGWIAGAGLDAHANEPLPSDSPYWDLPNVVVTPHNGATTARTADRGFEVFLKNLGRWMAGSSLVNVVDKRAGY